jgi:hypothetical protein
MRLRSPLEKDPETDEDALPATSDPTITVLVVVSVTSLNSSSVFTH